MGRRKIEMKRIEESKRRHVSFSKRRQGIFKKASELNILCDAEIAIIVFFDAGNPYVFGKPSVNAVIDRYRFGDSDVVAPPQLPGNSTGGQYWLDGVDVEGMESMEELDRFREGLKGLIERVEARAEELVRDDSRAASPFPSEPEPLDEFCDDGREKVGGGKLNLSMTAEEVMTPIGSPFSVDVNSKLEREAIGKIRAQGHKHVPVYSGNPKNIIGLLLVKSLLTVRAETETPVSAVSIRRIPRVPADMALYDILDEFQRRSSDIAIVVKDKGKSKNPVLASNGEGDIDMNRPPSLQQNDASNIVMSQSIGDVEDGEVIGIIILEDVYEKLLPQGGLQQPSTTSK